MAFCSIKLTNTALKDLVNNADDLEIPVYFGGPVQTDTIHFLHQYPDLIQGGYQVIDGIYWGGNFEKALELIRERKDSRLLKSGSILGIRAGRVASWKMN